MAAKPHSWPDDSPLSRIKVESLGIRADSAPLKRKSRAKKAWHATQKERKSALKNEIQRLLAQRESLQHSMPSLIVSLIKLQRENDQLRDVIREQQLLLARVHTAITLHSTAQHLPFEKYIHLGSDVAARVATFAELKHRALDDAERYINERARYLNPTQEFSQANKFQAPNGDLCYSGFDILPLEGFSSVKQVFDAMREFFFNMEITWTKTSNELMVREGDYESGEQGVVTQRSVRSTSSGTQIESNTVLYSRFRETGGGGGDSAVITVDFVDEDELYPYLPRERVRKDITAALTLQAYSTNKTPSGSEVGIIVLTRTYFGRVHQSELEIPSDVAESVSFGSTFWLTTMLRAVRDIAQLGSAHARLDSDEKDFRGTA